MSSFEKTKESNSVDAIYLPINGKNPKVFKIPDVNNLDFDTYPSVVKKNKGQGILERECDYSFDDDTIVLTAFTKGSEKNINKWELPPPIDNEIYYGNIVCIRLDKNSNPISMDVDYFNKFYEKAY